LTKRLQDSCIKLIDKELDAQTVLGNVGNIKLLCVIRDVCMKSAEADLTLSKNNIFEGINESEVMPAVESYSTQNDEHEEPVNYQEIPQKSILIKNFDNMVIEEQSLEESRQSSKMNSGHKRGFSEIDLDFKNKF